MKLGFQERLIYIVLGLPLLAIAATYCWLADRLNPEPPALAKDRERHPGKYWS